MNWRLTLALISLFSAFVLFRDVIAETIISGDLNIRDGGDLVFSDGSVQSKAQVQGPKGDKGDAGAQGAVGPPGITCADGNVLIFRSAGGWYCGSIMPVANGVAICTNGICSVSACAQNRGNCDGNFANGCEADLLNSIYSCGSCYVSCSGGQTCNNGVCMITPVTISTSSLATGFAGTSYSQTLVATGGTSPYTWSIIAGTLPAGLYLANGIISGTPTTTGSSTITVKVVDSASSVQSVARSFTLVVNAAPIPVSISTSALNAATVGTAFSQTLAATGGTTPYSWSITSGTLPAGLTLTTAGVISGTPTAGGSATITVKAVDSLSASASKSLTLTVSAAAIDGAALYTSNCAGCHGPLATSAKKGSSASTITSAISSVNAMKSFSFLTAAQIQAIATALK